MNSIVTFFIGLLVGIFLSALALVWQASKDTRQRFWIDENYKFHLIKRKRW